MLTRKQRLELLFVLTAMLTFRSSMAGDWPQFLGPDRNGTSAETGLLSKWPAAGPKVIWRTPLGISMSGIAISDGRAVTMYQDGDTQYLVALDAADGKQIWRTEVGPVYLNAMGNGPRATPTISANQVFTFTGEGILAACDTKDGRKLWSVDVPKSLSTTPSEYGMSCSPLVTKDLVIVYAGSDSAAVVAFDRATGKSVWKAGAGRAGYSSPMLMEFAGKQQVVALTGTALYGLDPASGRELWSFAFVTEYDCNTASPVQVDGTTILISAGENHGSALIEVTSAGTAFSAGEIWSSLGKDSQLRAEWQTPVIHDGHLYGLDNIGGAGPITNLVCIRLSDRKTMWMKPRFGKSNLILADGKLFVTTMKGELAIVAATPESFQELSRTTIIETTRQAPSLATGRLFVRDDHEVLCIDVTAAAP